MKEILELIDKYIKEKHSQKKWEAGKDWVQYAGPYFSSDEYVAAVKTLLQNNPEADATENYSGNISAIEKLTERVASLEGQNSTLNAELTKAEDKIEELSAVLKNTKTELSSLKKQPAAPSVKEQKRVVLGADKKEKSFAQMTLRERIIKNIENIK